MLYRSSSAPVLMLVVLLFLAMAGEGLSFGTREAHMLPQSFSQDERTAVESALEDYNACSSQTRHAAKPEDETFPVCFDNKIDYTRPLKFARCGDSEVPKIIHQIWKTKDEATRPSLWLTWKKLNPDWIHLTWTEEDLKEFISSHFNWFLPTFNAYRHSTQRVEAARYFVLLTYGGVYVDMDYECKLPFSNYVAHMSRKVGLVTPNSNGPGNDGFSNSFMIGPPGHPFWEFLTNQLRPVLRSILASELEDLETGDFSINVIEEVRSTTGSNFLRWAANQFQRGSSVFVDTPPIAINSTNDICGLQQRLFSPCYCQSCFAVRHYDWDWRLLERSWKCINWKHIVLFACCLVVMPILYFIRWQRVGTGITRYS